MIKEAEGIYALDCFGPQVTAGFSGREFDAARRSDFLKLAGFAPEKLVLLKQVHSANIVLVSSCYRPGKETQADGMITQIPGVALGILTADCVPVFFCDLSKGVVGITHAGWRGIHHGIIRKMAQAFKQNFMSRSEDIQVAFGPAARKCCYEVGYEFAHIFPDFYSAKAELKSHKGCMDLIGAIVRELEDEGVRADQIFDSKKCTCCQNDKYFSYRADHGTSERILSVISLKETVLS